MYKTYLIILLSIMAVFFILSAHADAGDLSRGWVYINNSKPECIQRAKKSLYSEKIQIRHTTEDFVFWDDGKSVGAIHCLTVNNSKTIAFIIAYGEERAKYLRDQFYTSMKTGMME